MLASPRRSSATVYVGGRLREHRRHRVQRREPDPLEPRAALTHRGDRDDRKVAGQHGCPADLGSRDSGGLRNSIRHHAFERALP